MIDVVSSLDCDKPSQAHTHGAYPRFHSMKRQGVSIIPPRWDACPLQGYPPHPNILSGFPDNSPVPIYTTGWRVALRE